MTTLPPALLLAAALGAAASPAAGLPASPGGGAPDPLRLLARLGAADPPIADVQAAVARLSEAATPDPIELATRRRVAALLPTLTAEVRADRQSYHVVGLQGSGEVDYLRSSPGTSLLLRATWELGDLVAARTEPVAASAALTRIRRRDEAVRRATHLYFERRRILLVLSLDPPGAPLARADLELDLARATAELEFLTGGLFSSRGWR